MKTIRNLDVKTLIPVRLEKRKMYHISIVINDIKEKDRVIQKLLNMVLEKQLEHQPSEKDMDNCIIIFSEKLTKGFYFACYGRLSGTVWINMKTACVPLPTANFEAYHALTDDDIAEIAKNPYR